MIKKILFQDTSFRDGFQSIFGARVLTKDFIPAVEAAVAAGITHFEAGGEHASNRRSCTAANPPST